MGRARVGRAVEILQEVAGPSHPVLFLKEGKDTWTPVSEDILCAIVMGTNSTATVVICDDEGNPKAMSEWIAEDKAKELTSNLESRGIPRFGGEVRLPT